MGVVKFEMDGVTKLVTTSELLQSALFTDKLSCVSKQGHLVILRSHFNIILRPRGISTYCKAVRLFPCPSSVGQHSDTVTVFRGAVMIHVNNNMLLVRVSADVLKA